MGSLAWAGSEARPGSGLPPVSSLLAQFHQPDRTLFFLLTPAFSLCSFWKNRSSDTFLLCCLFRCRS